MEEVAVEVSINNIQYFFLSNDYFIKLGRRFGGGGGHGHGHKKQHWG